MSVCVVCYSYSVHKRSGNWQERNEFSRVVLNQEVNKYVCSRLVSVTYEDHF